ncbi:MAG: hypothetical protein GXP55_06250 [Deltaproteobacteria bacterium]|nr:hypothetical protein [Deltaproteobacteria bacterium]
MHTPDRTTAPTSWGLLLLLPLLACGGTSSADDSNAADNAGESSGGEVAVDDFDGDLSLDDEDAAPQAGTVMHRVSAAEVLGLDPPEAPWADMDAQARNDYMIGKVLPIMDEAFRNHDAAEYPELQCEACHGPDGEARRYAMPSAHASIVPEPGTRPWTGMEATFPEMVEFMQSEVVPKMTSIMGREITCASCHPSAAPAN